ncbi:lytic polysaccharide monooxygenase, partial [Chryseobacterium sp. SIMBA_029]
HQITVPANRTGYHIILAVWDVADTTNAFYNVIDVNVTSGTGVSAPATPTGLSQVGVTSSSAKISWNPQSDAVSYNVFRNGQNI